MTVPEPEKVDKFAHTWVQNVNAYSVDKMGKTNVRTYKKYAIPMYWWEPISSWIASTQWTNFGLCDAIDGTQKQYMRATWTELLLLCQLQTGFRIRDNLDLASTERAFKTAFRKILNHTDIRIGGKKASIKQAWNMVPLSTVATFMSNEQSEIFTCLPLSRGVLTLCTVLHNNVEKGSSFEIKK